MKQAGYGCCVVATMLALAVLTPAASAQDTLKVADAHRGTWESAAPELGQQAGIFKKHGITLEFIYTRDDKETQQRVVSGSADVGLGVGVMAVMRAYTRTPRFESSVPIPPAPPTTGMCWGPRR